MSQEISQIDVEKNKELRGRYHTIDGTTFLKLARASLQWLRANQALVNALNVFPVPDGDTGTNMLLTMQSAVDETGQRNEPNIGLLTKALAHGALMGARGNSGVILSQIWRGIARSLDERQEMNAQDLADALQEARDTAYKGVVRPVEGTILTVSTDMAIAAQQAVADGQTSVLEVLETVVAAADVSVQYTPELLAVLKDAGVVDSGGKGLFFIFEGMLRCIYGLGLEEAETSLQSLANISFEQQHDNIEPGQDWEIVVDFRPETTFDLQFFYQELEEIGTSIQIGEGEGIYRMHIHVADKKEYEPIEYIKKMGVVTRVAIENLMDQQAAIQAEKSVADLALHQVEPGQIAAITVVPGIGIARVFASLGAAAIIEGGQTMNPSTQEILASIEDLPTDNIVIMPNNKNILMATKQAAALTAKKVEVISSISIPQGISAMLNLEPDGDLKQIAQNMQSALEDVISAEITIATRDVEIDGVPVKIGQVIGLINHKLVLSVDTLETAFFEILQKADAADSELITLYYGADLSEAEANQLADEARKQYPDQEIEIVSGGQPHYQIILSIE